MKIVKECKVETCKKPAKKTGFCGWCYRKFEKGIYDTTGAMSYKASQKEKAKERRAFKREEKEKEIIWNKKKDSLKNKIKLSHLKVLQKTNPETRNLLQCRVLDICISEIECIARIYLNSNKDRHKECNQCHLHDSRIDFLEDFVKTQGGIND